MGWNSPHVNISKAKYVHLIHGLIRTPLGSQWTNFNKCWPILAFFTHLAPFQNEQCLPSTLYILSVLINMFQKPFESFATPRSTWWQLKTSSRGTGRLRASLRAGLRGLPSRTWEVLPLSERRCPRLLRATATNWRASEVDISDLTYKQFNHAANQGIPSNTVTWQRSVRNTV